MPELKKTPLHASHQRLGARLVEFGGYEMPVQYSSILKEHAAVREAAGLFDVSHMGQIELSGPHALEATEALLSCRVDSLEVGRVRYGMLCNREGGVVDDVTLYRCADRHSDRVFMPKKKTPSWIASQVTKGLRPMNRLARRWEAKLQGKKLMESGFFMPTIFPLIRAGVDANNKQQYIRLDEVE